MHPPLNLRGVPAGARLYLGLSGGIDSSYLAWRLLDRGHPLLLHHCTYRTGQQRWPHEETAYRAVLDWLTAQGLTDWELITTEVDLGGTVGYSLLDYEYLLWIAALHLRGHREQAPERLAIHHLALTVYAEEDASRWRQQPRLGIWQRFEASVGRPIWQLMPMARLTKREIIHDMPHELFERTWWCRRPVDGQPCHRCHACRRVDGVLGHDREVVDAVR